MNILYLSNVRIPSEAAAGLAIVRQCQALSKTGHEVTLVTPIRNSKVQNKSVESMYGIVPNFEIKQIKSFTLYFFGKFGLYTMLLSESIKMFLYYLTKSKEIKVVYSRDPYILLPFILCGQSKKCFLEIHVKREDFVVKFITKNVFRLIVISGGLKNVYKNITGRNDLLMLPSGVDVDQFNNLGEIDYIRKKLGILGNKVIFGYVGKCKTMGEGKGVESIIESFALVYKECKNVFLAIIGVEEEEIGDIKKIFFMNGLPESSFVTLPLDQKKYAEYVSGCDILLMNYPDTEHYSYFMSPTKLFGYLASGKPIISSDLPSIREIADDNYIEYVNPGDVTGYAQKMIFCLENLSLLNKKDIERIELAKRFTWEKRSALLFK